MTTGKNPKEGQGASIAVDSPRLLDLGLGLPPAYPRPTWLGLSGLPPQESAIIGCQADPEAMPWGAETNFSPELCIVSSQLPRHPRLQCTSKGSLMNANDS